MLYLIFGIICFILGGILLILAAKSDTMETAVFFLCFAGAFASAGVSCIVGYSDYKKSQQPEYPEDAKVVITYRVCNKELHPIDTLVVIDSVIVRR